MLYPLTFKPLLKERVWGGRQLETLYQKPLPPGMPVGESWEISDRPGDISVVSHGVHRGKDLHLLLNASGSELTGASKLSGDRFPLLVKILDARDRLSLQVHPPAAAASALGGEPKTEMWYIVHADPGAELYVGLKRGTSREEFERQLRRGAVEECFHRVPVRAGDAMFLPSGRVHAIGAGLVIFEIQQNSDTTYRVFDWNRVGLDGKPRALHLSESLASIDFNDFEPGLAVRKPIEGVPGAYRVVTDPLFTVDVLQLDAKTSRSIVLGGRMRILGVVSGAVRVEGGGEDLVLSPGQFCLLPACLSQVAVQSETAAEILSVQVG